MLKRKKKQKLSRWARQEERAGLLFMTPAFIGLICLTYIPLLAVLGLSFFKWQGNSIAPPEFIGVDNYKYLFTADPYFWDSLKVTALFAIMAVLGSMVYSLVIAMLLNRKIPARGFFRALFYLPYILPAAAVYIGWNWLYETNFGLFNYILKSIGVNNVRFLASESAALPSLAVIAVWLSGNLIVIFLAGLQNVPRIYHEAAQIDGANNWQRFCHVTVPSMTPIIFYNLLMSLITNLQIVTPALALTGGGPGNSTRFLTYLMYFYGFTKGNIGRASAVSFISFLIIAVFTTIVFATSKSWVFYEGGED